MQKIKLPLYEDVQTLFREYHVSTTPADLHGLLTGFCCIEPQQDRVSWEAFLNNYLNNNELLPDAILELAQLCIENICISLNQETQPFPFLLPEYELNKEHSNHEQLLLSLQDYAFALTDWLNGFLSAIGLILDQSTPLNEEAQSLLMDLSEIARLEIDADDNLLEQSALFDELLDYISSAIFFFYGQIGRQNYDPMMMNTKPTIH